MTYYQVVSQLVSGFDGYSTDLVSSDLPGDFFIKHQFESVENATDTMIMLSSQRVIILMLISFCSSVGASLSLALSPVLSSHDRSTSTNSRNVA